MRKNSVVVLVMFLCLVVAAIGFAMDNGKAGGHDGGEGCQYCGMSLEKFAHSMMVINYDDGSTVKTCSVHCAAVDLAVSIDKVPAIIMVGDYNSKQHINAETAHWVIGGNLPGVMTKNAKWAFADRESADAFIKDNGGKIADFEEVMEMTFVDMYSDTRMIREKRKKMKAMKMSQ